MLQILQEQWTSSSGRWTQSEFYLQVVQKKKNRTIGTRRWMCRSEIITRFGSNEVADQMIAAKATDPEICKTHVRPNPDLHGLDTDDSWWIGLWYVIWCCLVSILSFFLSPNTEVKRNHLIDLAGWSRDLYRSMLSQHQNGLLNEILIILYYYLLFT